MTSTPSSSFRSGYVAIVGWPNVGKSTLLNALLGAKISIVSPRSQTTREAILGILSENDAQIIFLDTPGWLNPDGVFQGSMKRAIVRSIYDDADVIAWVIEPRKLTEDEQAFALKLKEVGKPVCVVVNKIDFAAYEPLLAEITENLRMILGQDAPVIRISAQKGVGLDALKSELLARLPVAAPYFPTDQITDKWERFYVAELIREQIFKRYQQEVPHASAVLVEEFIEKKGRKDLIQVSIVVETEGQMKIVVGEKGRAIKELGQASRQEIEERLGRPVFLELTVKVRKNWRKDEQFIKSVGELNL